MKDRWGTRKGSQSSPQVRVRKFESLEFESFKPREFESSKGFKLWGVEGLKFSSFENSKV